MNNPDGLRARRDAGLGPAPARSAPVPSPHLSRAASGVLDALAGSSPTTAAELAATLRQHPNTVREHLDALVRAGLASRARAVTGGRGRPAWRYAVAAPEAPVAPEYAGLATALAMQLARTSTQPQDDALAAGESWGVRLAGTAAPRGGDRRDHVVALLEGLGFEPEPAPDPRGRRGAAPRTAADADNDADPDQVGTIRLRRCPLLDAAQEEPEVVCAVHLGIVRGALRAWDEPDDAARLVPFAEAGACHLHLSPPAAR